MCRRGRRNQSSIMHSSATGSATQLSSATICISIVSSIRASGLPPYLQHREEGLLRDLDLTELLHAFLALFLFLEELALAADVAAIALGEHVLAQRLHGRARDDGAADRGLHR